MLSLLKPDSVGSFYLAFARSDREEIEPYMWTTRESTPILWANGDKIKKSEMIDAGFSVACLREEKNYLNIEMLEKLAQIETITLPRGRRLHQKRGGAAVNEDSRHMKFGLYVCFNPNGYSIRADGRKSGFILNKKCEESE